MGAKAQVLRNQAIAKRASQTAANQAARSQIKENYQKSMVARKPMTSWGAVRRVNRNKPKAPYDKGSTI